MKITEAKENDIVDKVFNKYSGMFFAGQRHELKKALYEIFTHLREEV